MTTDPALSITARLAAHGLTVRPISDEAWRRHGGTGHQDGRREILDADGAHVGFWRVDSAVAWLDEKEGR